MDSVGPGSVIAALGETLELLMEFPLELSLELQLAKVSEVERLLASQLSRLIN